jgi:glutathione-regulated potassium-efflux system protein KefB
MDLGVEHIERETFFSSLELTRDVLRGLGLPKGEIRFTVDTFKEHDEALLYENYAHYTDTEKMAALAMQRSEELAQVLAEDSAEREKRAQDKRKADTKPSLVRLDGKPLAAPAQKEPLRKSG